MKKHFSFICAVLIFTLVLITASGCFKTLPIADYNCSAAQYLDETDQRLLRVYYPVIHGSGVGDGVNEALKAAALLYMEDYLAANQHEGYYAYEIGTVTPTLQLPELASFLCVGSYSVEGSLTASSVVYTINIDPQSGEILDYDELVADYDILKNNFTSEKFEQVGGLNDLLEQISCSDIIANCDDRPPLYFIADENDVLLAFSFELTHKLGGHAEFAIDTDKIKKALSERLTAIIYE